MNENRDEFMEKMDAKVAGWDAEIAKLSAMKDKATAASKDVYARNIDVLKAKRDEVQKKLGQARVATDTAWKDMKGGLEVAVNAMSEAVKSAASRFN